MFAILVENFGQTGPSGWARVKPWSSRFPTPTMNTPALSRNNFMTPDSKSKSIVPIDA